MNDSSRALLSASLLAYLGTAILPCYAATNGDQPEPIRTPTSITLSSTTSNVTHYNVTVTAEDMTEPVKIVGEAPASDLNFRIETIIRQINRV
jgi:hypothetical protein